MTNETDNISDLLHRLSAADSGPAWSEFLDRYSPVILATISQFEYNQDRRDECFLFICEKLYEKRYRRLLSFNATGKASFPRWLSTVVFNLCVDWHRVEFGRVIVLPAIAALPAFDQMVYRYCYVQGMSRESCFQTIRSEFPELTEEQVAASLARIHVLLTPRQRWQHGVRMRRRGGDEFSDSLAGQIPDSKPEPEALAQADEEISALSAALCKISTDQRLLLHLRFQEGLAFKRIAQMEHLGDSHRARRHVQAALDALYLQFQKVKISQKRQK